jgi:N6-adenosine-specific RNA methylase IME4
MIDPPWRIKGAQQNDSQFMFSNCKFSLEYNTMSNNDIGNLNIDKLSDNGIIIIKYRFYIFMDLKYSIRFYFINFE